jgi:hypothetical protein
VLAIALISLYTRLNQGAQFLSDLAGLTGDDLFGLDDLTGALDLFTLVPGVGLFLCVIGNIGIIAGLVTAWNNVGYEEDVLPPIYAGQEQKTKIIGGEQQRTRIVGRDREERRKKKVQAWLTDRKGRSHQLNKGKTTIGRLAENDLQFSEKTISGRHATITETSGHFHLSDLDSTNGTFLNGSRVRGRTMLHPNDEIRFGAKYIVQFLSRGR